MKNCLLLIALLLVFSAVSLSAQDEEAKPAKAENKNTAQRMTPKNMWEVGANFGSLFVAGDVRPQLGYGGGISIRKATDYVFSLRLDALYGKAKGENIGDNTYRQFENNWLSVTGFGVFALNAFRFDRPVRKVSLYAMVGGGGNYYEVPDYKNEESRGSIDRMWAPHVAVGGGFAFRISPRINIGLDHNSSVLFGKRADLIDGSELQKGVRTPFRDIVNYTSVRVNVNIGNKQNQSEPLYWINPLQVVLDDINNMKNSQTNLLEDADGDGVLDQLDKELNTAPGALVDTKGRTLDSDRDGVPDHLDREPYYTPRQGETVDENGVVTNPIGGGGVTEERVRELIGEALQNYKEAGANAAGGSSVVADLFLPMIHFSVNSKTIKYSDYGTLSGIARVMKDNPNIRLVVKGYTDQTGGETYNQVLSYERALAIVDHLVNNHGIGRGRLVLQYGGQDEALVPTNSSYMNRRVELRVAKADEVEMDPPAGFDGKKKTGY